MIPIPIAIIAIIGSAVAAYFTGRTVSDLEHGKYLREHLKDLEQ